MVLFVVVGWWGGGGGVVQTRSQIYRDRRTAGPKEGLSQIGRFEPICQIRCQLFFFLVTITF